jgi:hypothetical protein
MPQRVKGSIERKFEGNWSVNFTMFTLQVEKCLDKKTRKEEKRICCRFRMEKRKIFSI